MGRSIIPTGSRRTRAWRQYARVRSPWRSPWWWPAGWPADEVKRLWQDLQAALVTRSSQGRQVIADKSGYNIPLAQPEVITAAIRQVGAAAPR